MEDKDRNIMRGFYAGMTLTYLCTGHFFFAGASLAIFGLVEYGLKKQEASR